MLLENNEENNPEEFKPDRDIGYIGERMRRMALRRNDDGSVQYAEFIEKMKLQKAAFDKIEPDVYERKFIRNATGSFTLVSEFLKTITGIEPLFPTCSTE